MKRQWLPPIIIVALGLFIMGYVYFSPERKNNNLISNNVEQTTIKNKTESVPTISLDSLANLGIKIILWMESPKDFEALHNVKLYRNKTIPVISFQSKEEIKFPYLWFEKKGEMELILFSCSNYTFDGATNHLEYLLKNKDKKFVVTGCYNNKEFEGALFEY